VPERAHRGPYGIAILTEDRSGQRVRRRPVDRSQHLVKAVVRLHERGDHRPEDLFTQQAMVGVRGLNERWLDEVAAIVLRGVTLNDALGLPCLRQIPADLRKRLLVDHRAYEV